MKITFIGVGEATDSQPNTSILIEGKTTLLLDCGYSVPPALWSYSTDPNLIDAIYISHLHADHYFGVAPTLLRMMEGERTKEVTIICPKTFDHLIKQSLDLAYGEIFQRLSFPIHYKTISENDEVTLGEYSLTFTPTLHPRGNHAIRVTDGKHVVCFSGDGRMTNSSKELYKNCDLLIHEAFHEKNKAPGVPMFHESIESLIECQESESIKTIAFVHVGKNEKDVIATYQTPARIFPAAGDTINL